MYTLAFTDDERPSWKAPSRFVVGAARCQVEVRQLDSERTAP
jgi:hypothetical protein